MNAVQCPDDRALGIGIWDLTKKKPSVGGKMHEEVVHARQFKRALSVKRNLKMIAADCTLNFIAR